MEEDDRGTRWMGWDGMDEHECRGGSTKVHVEQLKEKKKKPSREVSMG